VGMRCECGGPPFLIDPMLVTGIEARRSVGFSLCQVHVCRYGYTGSGARLSVLA